MRAILVLLCGTLLLASLFGLAHPGGFADAAHRGGIHATPHLQDIVCGEGSAHTGCQLVAAGSPDLPGLMAQAGTELFQIMPVTASGRSFPPRTPPPRHRS